MARFKAVTFLTATQITFLEQQAATGNTTVSAIIAQCVETAIKAHTGETPKQEAQPLTWDQLLIVGTNDRLIVQHGERYFCTLTRQYIDRAEVDRMTAMANMERK